MDALTLLSEYKVCGGVQRFYRHASSVIGLPMQFGVFLPEAALRVADGATFPTLFYLAGLTCNEETFAIKAGAQRYANEHGLILITPDTSPRGANIPGDSDAWDFGVGAGFYLDATTPAWRERYRMYSYIVEELTALVFATLPVDRARLGIFGHSMGGHGALVIGLRNPTLFKSISAFAPIAAPSECAWGKKAFYGYLGDDRQAWAAYDASRLVEANAATSIAGALPILIDQGSADKFLAQSQLQPAVFEAACAVGGRALILRMHDGYDHGYYFISTFVGEHIAHHARLLGV